MIMAARDEVRGRTRAGKDLAQYGILPGGAMIREIAGHHDEIRARIAVVDVRPGLLGPGVRGSVPPAQRASTEDGRARHPRDRHASHSFAGGRATDPVAHHPTSAGI
jgi:hypothetical protein